MADASENVTLTPPAPTTPEGGSDTYRPLSLMAILGFLFAALFAVFVLIGGLTAFAGNAPKLLAALIIQSPLDGIIVGFLLRERRSSRLWMYAGYGILAVVTILGLGGLVAFSGTQPWLLPPMVWLLVIAAVLACWMARTQIKSSEGTLGGSALANWGLALSFFFGLNYGAYLFSNTFAVRAQAEQCAKEFIELLKRGDITQAFIQTLPVGERPDAAEDVQRAIEIKHNITRVAQQPGSFSMFTIAPFVRYIQEGGAETTYQLESAEDKFHRGGYEVILQYKVHTPDNTFTLQVVTKGQEKTEASGTRRYWNVDALQTMITEEQFTEKGMLHAITSGNAQRLGEAFALSLRLGHREDAYLDTLPLAERKRQYSGHLFRAPAMMATTGLSLIGSSSYVEGGREAYEKGLKEYQKGGILDTKEFWADPVTKDEMLKDIYRMFSATTSGVCETELYRARKPRFWVNKDGTATVGLSTKIMMLDPKNRVQKHMYEAMLMVKGPISAHPRDWDSFYVSQIKLLRCQKAPDLGPGAPKPAS